MEMGFVEESRQPMVGNESAPAVKQEQMGECPIQQKLGYERLEISCDLGRNGWPRLERLSRAEVDEYEKSSDTMRRLKVKKRSEFKLVWMYPLSLAQIDPDPCNEPPIMHETRHAHLRYTSRLLKLLRKGL